MAPGTTEPERLAARARLAERMLGLALVAECQRACGLNANMGEAGDLAPSIELLGRLFAPERAVVYSSHAPPRSFDQSHVTRIAPARWIIARPSTATGRALRRPPV